MRRGKIATYAAVSGGAGIIVVLALTISFWRRNTVSEIPDPIQEQGGTRFVSSGIAVDMKRLQDIGDHLELPADAADKVKGILKDTYTFWSECQGLLDSGELRAREVDGIYMANSIQESQGASFHFVFGPSHQQIRQCRKMLSNDAESGDGSTRLKYKLDFYADGRLRTYEDCEKQDIAWFYPSGSVEMVYWVTQDGKAHTIRWTEDSTVLSERTGDRISQSEFLDEGQGGMIPD